MCVCSTELILLEQLAILLFHVHVKRGIDQINDGWRPNHDLSLGRQAKIIVDGVPGGVRHFDFPASPLIVAYGGKTLDNIAVEQWRVIVGNHLLSRRQLDVFEESMGGREINQEKKTNQVQEQMN